MAGLFERSGSAAASVLYLVVTGACLLGLLQLGGLLWGGRSGLYPCKPDNEVRCGGWAYVILGQEGAAYATLAAAWKAVCIRQSRVAVGQGQQRGTMSRQGPHGLATCKARRCSLLVYWQAPSLPSLCSHAPSHTNCLMP